MAYAKITEIKWDTAGQDKGFPGFCYVVVNIWPNRAAFDAVESPAEIQDFRMQLPAKDATERTPRMTGPLYELIGGGQWIQAELDAEITAWHQGKRKDPRDDLLYDDTPADHAAIIQSNIDRYLERWEAAPTSGDKRDQTLTLIAKDEPGGIVDKPSVQALIGLGIEQ